ncbi:hypothetical protein ACWDZ7_42545, partial [Streptomyces sp. NPDC003032]
IRAALHLRDPNTPIHLLDARSRDDARGALLSLLDMLITNAGVAATVTSSAAPLVRTEDPVA